MNKERIKINPIAIGIILAVVAIVIIAILVFIPLNGSEKHISVSKEEAKITALTCESHEHDNAFFTSDTANKIAHDIKVTFQGNNLSKVFYRYNGAYNSNDAAKKDEATLHAKYNIYMGENEISQESLAPTYSTVNTKLDISLYMEEDKKLNPATAVFFFIDKEKLMDYKKFSVNEMKDYYENKNFVCQIINDQVEE